MADHQQRIAQLMEEMGWTDGTFVPIANDENRLLMEEMQHISEEKEHKVQLEQQFNDRLDRLTKNLGNTKQSIQENSVNHFSLYSQMGGAVIDFSLVCKEIIGGSSVAIDG